jgi:hypothetical protein
MNSLCCSVNSTTFNIPVGSNVGTNYQACVVEFQPSCLCFSPQSINRLSIGFYNGYGCGLLTRPITPDWVTR